MSGTKSRDKGKRGEREVIELLQPVVNEVRESFGLAPMLLKRNTLQADRGGSDIAGLHWLAIECKYQEQTNTTAWWKQTLEQAQADQEPVLFYRRNNIAWRVKMHGLLGRVSCGQQVPVTVDVLDFIKWFRMRLIQQLEKEQGS